MSRPNAAAAELVALFDTPFLRSLTEPSRLEVLRVLILHGPADIQTVASHLPLDRSVVSRHLKALVECGAVTGRREGRSHIYAVDATAIIGTLEHMVARVKALVPLCCPP
jgi:DNA-binding transcriptional ArsR family regulator